MGFKETMGLHEWYDYAILACAIAGIGVMAVAAFSDIPILLGTSLCGLSAAGLVYKSSRDSKRDC